MDVLSLWVPSQEMAWAGAAGLGEVDGPHQGSHLLGLTFHRQLHCHLSGTTTIDSFTGVLSRVLLTDSMNHKAETPSDTTIQQEAAPTGDGLPISVPCHTGLWVTTDLQEKEERVRAYI